MQKVAKALVEAGAAKLGAQHIAHVTAKETAKYAATVAAQEGALAAVGVAQAQAATRYLTNIAASKATAQTIAKGAGPAAGVLAGPLLEMITLKCDSQEHDVDEYAEAAFRGFDSGAVSMVASVAAGAVAGSVVPGQEPLSARSLLWLRA